ncbi:PREDICTED: uncharacterized protein LOC109359115 isoform X2 [Lupinus angustifolius]|uniref:uncharacterized protein LOC109359115 isoform X2 n=1 Tax=Lupinus angustifolius TaxID=3871 RepID=UPI00092E3CEE|nr:PREDICTED: uncharacterized protein LOC109359115 isoform X2 [Lupinus angustifolius]XP_019459192.1 PREDICTED: uncharacterized protein LOC109359115 isoform X2 [Lupinus angustifolius]
MAFEDDAKKELKEVSRKISKAFPLSRTSLASMESLSLPMVQEVVLSADMQCEKCLKRITDIIAKMNEIETHMIEKQKRTVCVCGRFVPADVAIRIKKKMNRRVEILEVEELGGDVENEHEQLETAEETERPHIPMVVYPGQGPSYHPTMPMGQCM